MDIILHGSLNQDETAQSLTSVLRLLHERYHIDSFREIHLEVTLVDEQGNDVELMDNKTNEVYRIFEVRQQSQELSIERPISPSIHLVVDNTQSPQGKK